MTGLKTTLIKGLVVLVVLTPLGILLPLAFRSGDAWGEWGTETLRTLLGYLPEGLKRTADLWKAPLADYALGGKAPGTALQVVYYLLSGVLGAALVAGVVYILSKALTKHEK